MKKVSPRVFKAAVPFAVLFAVFCALAFFPRGKKTDAAEQRIVSVWNVDTFEGGKGSRTAFLARAARLAEKKNENVFYYVTSYSAEGFFAAAERGELPDALSFGIGLGEIAGLCLPLGRAFAGGETADGCLAYPWCGGGYVLYSKDNNFSDGGRTAISSGGENLPDVAAALAGIKGERVPSTEAYTGFLSGKYRYLLGTQRDRCRFAARGTAVCERPLGAYCDLYQYFAVLSREKRDDCLALLGALLSEEVQGALSDIGMESTEGRGGTWTANVFTPAEALREIEERAEGGELAKFPEKYLKTV